MNSNSIVVFEAFDNEGKCIYIKTLRALNTTHEKSILKSLKKKYISGNVAKISIVSVKPELVDFSKYIYNFLHNNKSRR